jgi:5-formyltetrahydrofolate cyclo-ligase
MTSSSPKSASGLREAKRLVRERVLRARNAIPPELHAESSQRIAAALAQRPDFVGARIVLLTLPYGSEWDTRLLFHAARARGKTVAVPRVNLAQRMLELYAVGDLAADVAAGYRGIPEPKAGCPAVALESIDWLLVPGVAFDALGQRVGYGGGYYDRLLPMLPASVPRIAGAFELQILDRVPSAPHDLAIDAIVTETRVLVPAR